MKSDDWAGAASRHKGLLFTVIFLIVAGAAITSASLPKTYSSTGQLLVTLKSEAQSFDAVQAGQAVTRSYLQIIDSPNIAEQVGRELGTSGSSVEAAASFKQVPETQLLEITVSHEDPAQAERIADAYADVFIDYTTERLAPNTEAVVTLADNARQPSSPSRPRPLLYVLVAALMAIPIALGAALLRDRMDRRLHTIDDVRAAFDLPVIGRLPRRGSTETLQAVSDEAYRVFNFNLKFATAGALRSVAITSAVEREGKTTSAAGLAIASAGSGDTIAVEADLRRPALERTLRPHAADGLQPGLSSYLANSCTLEEAIHPTDVPDLRLVPAGMLPPLPAALLESDRAQTLVSDLTEKADLVIIDCPPLTIGETRLIAKWVDAVVLVIDLRSSTDRSVAQAIEQLQAVQAPLVGLVLNRDRDFSSQAYGYYVAANGEPEEKGRRRGLRTGDRSAGRDRT